MKISNFCLILATFFTSYSLFAFNYHELHVYGHQTEGEGIIEIENTNSLSTNQDTSFNNDAEIIRSSLEINYGLRDWLDAAIYADFVSSENDEESEGTQFAGSRYRLHARFFEKGEQYIDLGAYLEIGIPNDEEAIYELEFKPILEKDFEPLTFILNPIFEYELEKEKEMSADGEEETEYKSEFKMAYAFATQLRTHSRILPSLNFFGDFAQNDSRVEILRPQVDYKFSPWSVAIGLGFGLTPASEKRILHAAIEVEM